MKEKIISGIQQVGIGVPNVHEAWGWYKKYFGVDVRIFEKAAPADHMFKYTGGKSRNRHAALAINLSGGGGFEIWQFTDRTPQSPDFELQLGDLGIFATKIKSKNVQATHDWFTSEGLDVLSEPYKKGGKEHFFVRDPYHNIFQVVSSMTWFRKEKKLTGAAYGAILGVTDMERSVDFYSSILGYDEIIYDEMNVFEDYSTLPGGDKRMRRVLLRHSQPRLGAFSMLLGTSQIELVQVLDRKPAKIFQDRYWGDLGFIHICYDIRGMAILREECKAKGCPFTVDTGDTFDMGEAAGAFSYTEDPDGTLIEFVETHRVPILKKLGIYLNLHKRNQKKALPNWMVKALKMNKANDIKMRPAR